MARGDGIAVAVRGVGAVTALGSGVEALWAGLASGRRALSGEPLAGRIDRARARVELARRASDLERRALAPEELFLAFAFADALERAGLDARDLSGERTAVVVGTTKGALSDCERAFRRAAVERARPAGPLGSPAQFLAGAAGARGAVLAVSQACSSGTAAFAHGARLVSSGEVDRAVVAGVETLEPFIEEGFRSLRALDPRGARPFDRARGGLSLGEGAAVALLERATPGERGVFVRGWGGASDALHVTAPDPAGEGLARALRAALVRGAVPAREVAFVCAHGTGTVKNDASELKALERVLAGGEARVFSIKGHLGHTLGAAGAIDAVTAVLALERGAVPGTAGLEDPEPAGALRLPRTLEPIAGARFGLSANAGFGGFCSALAFEVVA
jgi:3-oxoacyl-(acyl-carrier-protein) synthase